MKKERVAVIGLGAIGAQTLWQLSKNKDIELHGYESGYIGHATAGSGGEGRLFRNLELTTRGYMPLVKESELLWRELESLGSQRLRRISGVLLMGPKDNAQVQHALECGREWDVEHEVLENNELRKRFPHFNVKDDYVGLWDPMGGVISPELSITVAVEQAISNGAQVHELTTVSGVKDSSDGVQISLENGESSQFDRVVVVAGGWSTKLVPELRDWVVTRRLTSAWFSGIDNDSLRGMPPFMQAAPNYCYGIPNEDEQLVKLGLGFNDHLPVGDPDTVPRALSHEESKEQIEKFSWILRDFLPNLRSKPVRMETYIESYSRSMHEFLGVPDGLQNVVALTGFSGHGFKIAPALGKIGAQLALRKKPDIDIGFLSQADPVFDISDVEAGLTTYNSVVASNGR